ncbi:MAG: response regulator transcription factor [Desulfobacterota bacterium]|nr:response regulator transcription factor [Thermodesulfobacteriota bacterium]
MEKQPPKKVLIIDDHPLIRHGITRLVQEEDDVTICGEAEDAADALAAIERSQPDIVVLDIMLKTVNGLDLITTIRDRFPDLPILILSMHDETLYAERALRAGAQGYVMKQDSPEKLIEAIRRVLDGQLYLSESMTARMLKKIASGSSDQEISPFDLLSARELEVFRLIGKGTATRDIAAQLGVSVKTVDAHRANIKKKLELKSGAELVQRAIKWVLSQEPSG